jgi:hypothetical protein
MPAKNPTFHRVNEAATQLNLQIIFNKARKLA